MLKTNSTFNNPESSKGLEALKLAVTATPVLAFPNFSKGYIVECDASNSGIEAVLQQECRLIAFFSHSFFHMTSTLAPWWKELV